MQRRSFQESISPELTEQAERLREEAQALRTGLCARSSFAKPGRRRQLRMCASGFHLRASSHPVRNACASGYIGLTYHDDDHRDDRHL
jgi:hypothetical protein